MHPNAFLRTFWRGDFKPQVFVAMSFDAAYKARFDDVIRPAIEDDLTYNGAKLKAVRVDLSKSGDSILTDIIEGIAHSIMVLADVSVVGYDSKSGHSYRNANVMYEIGIALACRQSAEVLLVRDDTHKFLFDVSTIPHLKLDFADAVAARAHLAEELSSRLREINLVRDARAQVAIASLTGTERKLLGVFAHQPMEATFGLPQQSIPVALAVSRLLDKQLIRTSGMSKEGQAMFCWTPLGKAMADHIDTLVPVFEVTEIARPPTTSDKG
jgi:hypothetical protein